MRLMRSYMDVTLRSCGDSAAKGARDGALPARGLLAAVWGSCNARDGMVSCWGYNSSGQLGDGTRNQRWSAMPVVGLTGAQRLSTGNNHNCATTADASAVGVTACTVGSERGRAPIGFRTDASAA
jgi:hypothetical protein